MYYLCHKFICINFSFKSVGEAWESWGEGGVYELKAVFGNLAERFLPARWLPQYAICAKRGDDFLHKREVQRVLHDAL